MTKLVIQVPCFNEAKNLPVTLGDLPGSLEGIDSIETLVIDDGSTDGTAKIAREHGVDRVVRIPINRGLANAFAVGLEESLKMGADIIVNTDADNQYPGAQIADLIEPILDGDASIVVGDRQIDKLSHFSRTKKILQKLGSWVVRWASDTDVPDATSGFRAIDRDAAIQLNVFSNYTYTLETLIQAGKKGIPVTSVPIDANPTTRQSRLIRNYFQYIVRSAVTILRIFLMYEALRVFLTLSVLPVLLGGILLARYAYFFVIGDSSGHVQSLIAATILLLLGFITILIGLLGDLIARNRRLSEEIRYMLKLKEHGD
jgi:glycosyltransferase involved in cell wall biosynthesis